MLANPMQCTGGQEDAFIGVRSNDPSAPVVHLDLFSLADRSPEAGAPGEMQPTRGSGAPPPRVPEIVLMGTGQPVSSVPRIGTDARVVRLDTSCDRCDVPPVGSNTRSDLFAAGDGAMSGNDDLHKVFGEVLQQVQRRQIGGALIDGFGVQQRNFDVGQHVPGQQHAGVGQQHRQVPRGVRVVFEHPDPPIPRHRAVSGGKRDDLSQSLERRTRRELRC